MKTPILDEMYWRFYDDHIPLWMMGQEAPTIAPEAPAAPAEEKPKEERSALDEAKDDAEPKDENGGSKPPEDGPCKRCGEKRRLNRLRLCYPCFVIWNIQDIEKKKFNRDWTPEMPHPKWCDCEGLGEHPERDHGAWRGN